MTCRFYLYGTFNQGSDTLRERSFSFTVEEHCELSVPSFLVWFFRDTDDEALLCKVRRTTKPADIGMSLYVYDAVRVRLVTHGIMNSVYPDMRKITGISGREQVNDMILLRTIVPVPDEKAELVKNAILRSNRGTVDETYFAFEEPAVETELTVEVSDAIHTAFRIFGLRTQEIPELREHQILDFDISTIFADSKNVVVTPDGKHCFEHQGRRLYLHKVDRTRIEECLGVDLIYNYLDERRLVFVQYKCQARRGKYYASSDGSHDSELYRMRAIPGITACANMKLEDEKSGRLCGCPVFVKLCKREVSYAHAVPIGVYFPVCIWQCLVNRHRGLSVKNEPHINNPQFQELVKTGLIGSTEEQTIEIERHLIEGTNDNRLKLIFEETVVR